MEEVPLIKELEKYVEPPRNSKYTEKEEKKYRQDILLLKYFLWKNQMLWDYERFQKEIGYKTEILRDRINDTFKIEYANYKEIEKILEERIEKEKEREEKWKQEYIDKYIRKFIYIQDDN